MSWTSLFKVVLQNKQSVLRQLHVQSPLLNSLYLPPFYSTVLHRTFKTCTRFCVHVFFPVFLPENRTSSPACSSFAVFCFYHFLRCTKKAWKHMHPRAEKGLNAKRALFKPSNSTPQTSTPSSKHDRKPVSARASYSSGSYRAVSERPAARSGFFGAFGQLQLGEVCTSKSLDYLNELKY